MEKEGASVSDRPRSISVGETLSGGMRALLTGDGARLKKFRRCVQLFCLGTRTNVSRHSGYLHISRSDSCLNPLLRRVLHANLQPKFATVYRSIQIHNAKHLITNLIQDPENHQSHANRLVLLSFHPVVFLISESQQSV